MTSTPSINPFYSARRNPVPRVPAEPQVRWAKLPQAPITASPVPHLTSLYHWNEPGKYGDRSYPGNCSGHIIRDVIKTVNKSDAFEMVSLASKARDAVQAKMGIRTEQNAIAFLETVLKDYNSISGRIEN